MPCADCGASLERSERAEHVCDPERRLDYELFTLRDHTARLEGQIEDYFTSPEGRFEAWYAEHKRRPHD
jgi:hypothetical protein